MSVKDAVSLSLSLGATVEQALVNPTIESLEALQKEWLEKVHPNHYHLHAVKHSLLQLYGRTQEKADTSEKNDTHWKVNKCSFLYKAGRDLVFIVVLGGFMRFFPFHQPQGTILLHFTPQEMPKKQHH